MSISKYSKRALAEITGRPIKSSSPSSKQFLVVAATAVVLLLGLIGWLLGLDKQPTAQQAAPDPNCAFRITDAHSPPPVTQGDAAQLNTCMRLERVDSEAKRILGLSNRPSMSWDHGMLFDFDKPDRYCMWMKDMHFSLDMLWLNEKYEIVAIRQHLSPDTYPTSYCGPETARYVIEVNSGVVQAGDLRLGQHIGL